MADPFASLNKACVDVFGIPASYRSANTAASLEIRGVLQKDTDTERDQDAPYARLFICVADLTIRPELGDTVIVDSETYVVFQVLADPTGGAWLSLRAR